MIEMISGIVVPVVIAIFGAAGWASERNGKLIDRRFNQIAEMVDRNEKDIEKVERDLKALGQSPEGVRAPRGVRRSHE